MDTIVRTRKYISDDTKVTTDQYLFKHNDVNFFPTNNISLIQGQAKNGKSFLCSILASAAISGDWDNTITTDNPFKVLYIDTEQSECKVKNLRDRIRTMCSDKYNPDYLTMVSLNGTNDIKKEFYETITENENKDIKLVILDGIVDLCEDFNNQVMSKQLVQEIRDIATNEKLHIVCVLHENPGSNKARGHLGTFLENKCTETIQLSKDDDNKENPFFSVKFINCRDKQVPEFGYNIEEIDGIAIPQYFNAKAEREYQNSLKKAGKHLEKRREYYDLFEGAFKTAKQLSHKALKEWLIQKYGILPNSTGTKIYNAVRYQALCKVSDDKTSYYLNPDCNS